MALVVDASVGLKWVLREPDSMIAETLLRVETDLMVPDFWLHEATNVLWLQVRKRLFSAAEAQEALAMLRAVIQPIPTADMGLHDVALAIGIAVNHSTYDTMYLAFAVAVGANRVVVADAGFIRDMRLHPDPSLAAMLLPLDAWGAARGITAGTAG